MKAGEKISKIFTMICTNLTLNILKFMEKKIQHLIEKFGFTVYTVSSKAEVDDFIWEVTGNE